MLFNIRMRAALALGDLPSTSAVLLCATVIKGGGEVIQQRSTCHEINRRAPADAGSDCRSLVTDMKFMIEVSVGFTLIVAFVTVLLA